MEPKRTRWDDLIFLAMLCVENFRMLLQIYFLCGYFERMERILFQYNAETNMLMSANAYVFAMQIDRF